MKKQSNRKIVYRFKVKVSGGEWRYVVDANKVPITISTDKPQNTVVHIFKHRYPSIASTYQLGETLIEEPDWEATKRVEEFQRAQKEEEDRRIQGMWWND